MPPSIMYEFLISLCIFFQIWATREQNSRDIALLKCFEVAFKTADAQQK